MASFQPFLPAVKTGTAGLTQSITIGAGAGTSQTIQINSGTAENPSILVTFDGPTVGTAYIRMSVEASTSIVATATDTPFPFGPNPTVRLFANPSPTGIVNIAVVVTVTPATAGTMWFTPGEGGIV
jgi:hypothetical protein